MVGVLEQARGADHQRTVHSLQYLMEPSDDVIGQLGVVEPPDQLLIRGFLRYESVERVPLHEGVEHPHAEDHAAGDEDLEPDREVLKMMGEDPVHEGHPPGLATHGPLSDPSEPHPLIRP